MSFESLLLRRRTAAAVAVVACLSVSLLAWLGYVAVREWQRSVARLAAREAEDASDLFLSALTRDMRAVQRSVLSSPALDAFTLRPPYEAINLVASAFAQYQYPESFFLWRRDSTNASGLLLNRRERLPAWAHGDDEPNRFPLIVDSEAPLVGVLVERIRTDAAQARRFSVFETTFGGVRYQVVARLFYSDRLRQQLDAVFGFTVNLDWVRQHYFSSLLQEAVWMRNARTDVQLVIMDEGRQAVSSTGAYSATNAVLSQQRVFPLMFFNPVLIAADPPPDLQRQSWVVQATTRDDSSLVAALRTGNRMLVLQAVAASALAFGLVLTIRASRSSLKLADAQSEFVASVTHEFKTPIATIQAAGESLASGRIEGALGRQEYAGFIVQEARRLTRLVDNLLTFSRITDTAVVRRHYEPLALGHIVNESVERFALHLAERSFAVHVEVSPDLPRIAGDASAIGLMIDNLVDNSIRHSKIERQLRITSDWRDGKVILQVADRGGGIAKDELDLVTRKFYRGRDAGQGGTGLGLAIANRIVSDHGGTLTIGSDQGVGTTVTVSLPVSSADPVAMSRSRTSPIT